MTAATIEEKKENDDDQAKKTVHIHFQQYFFFLLCFAFANRLMCDNMHRREHPELLCVQALSRTGSRQGKRGRTVCKRLASKTLFACLSKEISFATRWWEIVCCRCGEHLNRWIDRQCVHMRKQSFSKSNYSYSKFMGHDHFQSTPSTSLCRRQTECASLLFNRITLV